MHQRSVPEANGRVSRCVLNVRIWRLPGQGSIESLFTSQKNGRTVGRTCAIRQEAGADMFDQITRLSNAKRRCPTIGNLSPG